MKKIFLCAVWAICLAAAAPLAAQTITLNKCLVNPPIGPTYQSGEFINYQISAVVNGGNAVDLEITDVLPANLGIDPSNIINQQTPYPCVVTVTGGIAGGCSGGYWFGATVKWKFTGIIPSGSTLTRQITVKSREGETFACQQINAASARAANILCSPVPFDPPTVPTIFYSNSILVNIDSKSDWQVSKKSIGYIGVNVIRYKITVNRQFSNTLLGYHNLYNGTITDLAPVGAVILNAFGGPYLSHVTSPSNLCQISLKKLDVCQSWPQYLYVDIAYPCNPFPAGTSVENCINLKGDSPPDCNFGQPPYSESIVQLCTGQSTDPQVCPKNWTGTGPFGVYNYPVTPTNVVLYPGTAQKYVCTKDTLPAFYKTELSIVKGETYAANHFAGCQGQYFIRICNNGNSPATNISVKDIWPQPCSNLTLLPSPTFSPSNAFSSVTYTGPSNCPTNINFNTNSNFTLFPGDCITIYMNFEINATVPLNTLIRNCVKVNYTGSFGPPAPLCPNQPPVSGSDSICYDFRTEMAKAKPAICKSVEGGSNYQAGQKVKYKICISNYGGAGLTGQLVDLLDPQLINPTILGYYYSPNAGASCLGLSQNSYQPLSALPLNPINSQPLMTQTSASNPVSWNVNLPPQCQVNKFATLCILLEAEVAPYTPSGTYWNKATLTPTGGTAISASAPITVAQLTSLQSWKCVKGDLDADFNSAGSATPGSIVKFRVSVLNNGTVPLKDIVVADQLQLPFTSFSGNPVVYINTTPATTTGCPANVGTLYTGTVPLPVYLAALPNPITCITKNGCTTGTCPPPNISGTPTNIVQLSFGNSLTLMPGQLLTVELQAVVPASVPVNTRLCNKAWARACSKVDNSSSQQPISEVCLTVKPFVPNCCPPTVKTSAQVVGSPVFLPQGVNGTLMQATFALSASPVPIQEVRVTIVDKDLNYQPDAACVQCYTRYKFLGTFVSPFQPFLGALPINCIGPNMPYTVINKELVYKGNPASFVLPQNLAVNILLPDLQNIPCCEAVGEVCLKFVFKDANCNYCEMVVCVPVRYPGQ